MFSLNLSLRLILCLLGLSSVIFQAAGAHVQARHRHRRTSITVSQHREQGNLITDALEKRDGDKRFSWYDVGQGACGGTNVPSDFIVALDAPQWDDGSHCWEMITITYQGKSTQAQIVDLCPSCPPGALDFSHGLFAFFAGNPEDVGIIYGDWSFSGGEPKPTLSHTPDPTSTTQSTTTSKRMRTHTSSNSAAPTSTSETTSSTESFSTATSSSASPSASASDEPQLIQLLDIAIVQLGGVIMAGRTVQSE